MVLDTLTPTASGVPTLSLVMVESQRAEPSTRLVVALSAEPLVFHSAAAVPRPVAIPASVAVLVTVAAPTTEDVPVPADDPAVRAMADPTMALEAAPAALVALVETAAATPVGVATPVDASTPAKIAATMMDKDAVPAAVPSASMMVAPPWLTVGSCVVRAPALRVASFV